MYRRHGEKLVLIFLASDLAVTAACWLLAYFARFAFWPSPQGVPRLAHVADGLPMVVVLAAITYRQCGLYEMHRLRQLPRELRVICQASALLFLLTIAITFYRRDAYESRLALMLFLGGNAAALLWTRRLLWWGLRQLRGRGLNRGRAVIVGCGRTGRRVAAAIGRHGWTGLEAVGFVDFPPAVEPRMLPRLGALDELSDIIRRHDIDHVFLALPLARYSQLPALYQVLAQHLVEVQFVPEIPDLTGMRIRALEIDRLAFLSLRANPHAGWHRAAKRAIDVLGALAALVVLGPLMLVLAAAVKLSGPGQVLYRQRRVGLGGRQFAILKFRSMRVDAEAETGPVWARPGDDRCTPLGRFMRRWNLDELPQLFNVLAGDMSLVGPRPERRYFTERFQRQLPSYAQRHWVKAGMTGWAQVHGWRGNTSLRRRLEFDLYYIANWSLWLDLEILWLTLWRGFRRHGAY